MSEILAAGLGVFVYIDALDGLLTGGEEPDDENAPVAPDWTPLDPQVHVHKAEMIKNYVTENFLRKKTRALIRENVVVTKQRFLRRAGRMQYHMEHMRHLLNLPEPEAALDPSQEGGLGVGPLQDPLKHDSVALTDHAPEGSLEAAELLPGFGEVAGCSERAGGAGAQGDDPPSRVPQVMIEDCGGGGWCLHVPIPLFCL